MAQVGIKPTSMCNYMYTPVNITIFDNNGYNINTTTVNKRYYFIK